MKIVASDGEYVNQNTAFVIDYGEGFALFSRDNGTINLVDDPATFGRFIPELVGVGVDFPFDRDPEIEKGVLDEFVAALGTHEIFDNREVAKAARRKAQAAK